MTDQESIPRDLTACFYILSPECVSQILTYGRGSQTIPRGLILSRSPWPCHLRWAKIILVRSCIILTRSHKDVGRVWWLAHHPTTWHFQDRTLWNKGALTSVSLGTSEWWIWILGGESETWTLYSPTLGNWGGGVHSSVRWLNAFIKLEKEKEEGKIVNNTNRAIMASI